MSINSKYKTFEDLPVYQESLDFTVIVFKTIKKEGLKSEFAIIDQLKRATLSISNNIAEGFERQSNKELARFLYIAKGSAGEVRSIVNVLEKLELLTPDEINELKKKVSDISRQLGSYIKYVQQRDIS
jgi:four helix bundle protein